MSSSTFVIFGSGPGIGTSVASIFAEKHFDRVVLCARNAESLEKARKDVEAAAIKVMRYIRVSTIQTDLTDLASLRQAFKEIERLGPLGCVYHNAARIRFSEPLTTPVAEIEEDFKVSLRRHINHRSSTDSLVDSQSRPLRNSSMGHPSPQIRRPPNTIVLRHQQPSTGGANRADHLALHVESQSAEHDDVSQSSLWQGDSLWRYQSLRCGRAGEREVESDVHR